jgi:hypothetical protein
MSGPTEFTIGSEVCSGDGPCGELRRVVIDPVSGALTHLVVGPRGREKGHLVPVNLAVPTTDGVALACTTAEFEELDETEDARFIPGGSGQFRYGPGQMPSWPHDGLAAAGTAVPGPQPVINQRAQIGAAEVRRGEHVLITDGAIGRV